jgi:chromosome segregation ATPase
MLRRVLFWGIAGTVVAVLIFGKHLHSYVGTAAGWVQDSVKQAIPMEFEIDRARNMVKNIMPEIRKNMQIIAKEEVEVDRLSQEITQLNKKQDKDRADLTSLRDDLTSGGSTFRFASRTYTVDQVKCDLANRLERYQTSDATLASLREMQEARQKSLDAAREKLDEMLAQKRQLEVDVENLEARLKMVEVAQTSSSYNFDDSQLGNLKELIGDLRTRLSVEEKMVNAEDKLQGEIPVDQPATATDNIVQRVTEYLGGPKADVTTAAGPTTTADGAKVVAQASISK